MKKIIFTFTLIFSFATSAQSFDCEPMETHGKTLRYIGDRILGKDADTEFSKKSETAKVDETKDALGFVRILTVQEIISLKTWDSSRKECNDHQVAKITRICTKSDSESNNAACASLCEQSSFSDDCR